MQCFNLLTILQELYSEASTGSSSLCDTTLLGPDAVRASVPFAGEVEQCINEGHPAFPWTSPSAFWEDFTEQIRLQACCPAVRRDADDFLTQHFGGFAGPNEESCEVAQMGPDALREQLPFADQIDQCIVDDDPAFSSSFWTDFHEAAVSACPQGGEPCPPCPPCPPRRPPCRPCPPRRPPCRPNRGPPRVDMGGTVLLILVLALVSGWAVYTYSSNGKKSAK